MILYYTSVISLKKYYSLQNAIKLSRTFSGSPWLNKKTNPSLPNLATTEEATKKTEIKRKAFSRMFEFVENYGEKVLAKLLPEIALKAVKTFSSGTKNILSDMKEYKRVNQVLTKTSNWQNACLTLSRRQLEVHISFNHMRKYFLLIIICLASIFFENSYFITDLLVLAWRIN